MTVDQNLIDAVKKFEGYAPSSFWDQKQYTSGYGTRARGPSETIDRQTAESRLRDEISKAAGHVDKAFPTLPSGARNALISLTYNAGPGWISSGLGRLVGQGDLQGAKDALLQYNKAGGAVLPGLVSRRQTEASWFDQAPPRPPMPIPTPEAPRVAPFSMAPPTQAATTSPQQPIGQLANLMPLSAPPQMPPPPAPPASGLDETRQQSDAAPSNPQPMTKQPNSGYSPENLAMARALMAAMQRQATG